VAAELRKLAGSRWYTDLGAERAAALLGHGNVAVTCQFYAALDRKLTAEQVDAVFTQGNRHAG
jgi:cobalamin biosynthesis Co2+ chelatase CbiK